MICENPWSRYQNGPPMKEVKENMYQYGVYPCGVCLPCRMTQKRTWVFRMMLELECHELACFVTLTYEDTYLPKDKSVSRPEFRQFMKNMHKYYKGLRYYAVGEYGEKTWRPHYHLLLFGVSKHERRIIEKCWSTNGKNRGRRGSLKGIVHIGDVNEKSIRYVAGYTANKLLGRQKRIAARGLKKEFTSVCQRPALGKKGLMKYIEKAKEKENVDRTATAVYYHGKWYSMGRTLQLAWDKEFGVTEVEREDILNARIIDQLHRWDKNGMYLANAKNDPENQTGIKRAYFWYDARKAREPDAEKEFI